MAKRASSSKKTEQRITELARGFGDQLSGRGPSLFHGRWWEDRLLNWAAEDQSVRLQMLRFAAALPTLRRHDLLARFLEETYVAVRQRLPGAVRLGLEAAAGNNILSRALAWNARSNAGRMAGRFLVSDDPDAVMDAFRRHRVRRCTSQLDIDAGPSLSPDEADEYLQVVLNNMEQLAEAAEEFPEDHQVDCDPFGHLPRLNLAVHVERLGITTWMSDGRRFACEVAERLRPIVDRARGLGCHLQFAAAPFERKRLCDEIVRGVVGEREFRGWSDFGLDVVASHTNSDEDLKWLLGWAGRRSGGPTIRLLKGGRREMELFRAMQFGGVSPVFSRKWQTDQRFEELTVALLKKHEKVRPVFGTHHLRSLSAVLAHQEQLKVPADGLEIQMLHGLSPERAQLMVEQHVRVRQCVPLNHDGRGLSRLASGLLDNAGGTSLLYHLTPSSCRGDDYLLAPSTFAKTDPPLDETMTDTFRNEPLSDFTDADVMAGLQEATREVRERLGTEYPLVIDGKSCDSRASLVSRNPGNPKEILGRVSVGSADQIDEAVTAASRAAATWSTTSVQVRAEYLQLVAAEMRERRAELTALIMLECGLLQDEADAEVASAIDYCMYYAAEMPELGEAEEQSRPGETTSIVYRPRGVVGVISSWSSPLAELTGMVMAAVVAGNTVVMKPAEQASVVAARLMEILRNAEIPDGVVSYVPGPGQETGAALAAHPGLDVFCFSGSGEVGGAVLSAAATDSPITRVRHVVAHLGGKNAIVVDDTADPDAVVQAVLRSAFGAAGQSALACSRVIVTDAAAEDFCSRLKKAAGSLQVGQAEDPATTVGPLIDEDSLKALQKLLKTVDPEIDGELVYTGEVPESAGKGYFLPPHIFVGTKPESRLARLEQFGPILCVMRVRDVDDAFRAANSTEYALTGAVFSRSPETLERARTEFRCGSLFLNRPPTGARVGRHPVGGYRMSGSGALAGSRSYLKEFLLPTAVTESTAGTGFAAEESRPVASE